MQAPSHPLHRAAPPRAGPQIHAAQLTHPNTRPPAFLPLPRAVLAKQFDAHQPTLLLSFLSYLFPLLANCAPEARRYGLARQVGLGRAESGALLGGVGGGHMRASEAKPASLITARLDPPARFWAAHSLLISALAGSPGRSDSSNGMAAGSGTDPGPPPHLVHSLWSAAAACGGSQTAGPLYDVS
jgi:hypothetical protein